MKDDGTEVKAHWRSKPGSGNGGVWDEEFPDLETGEVPDDTDIANEEEPNIVSLVIDFAIEIASLFIKDEEVIGIIKAVAPLLSTMLPKLLDGEEGG